VPLHHPYLSLLIVHIRGLRCGLQSVKQLQLQLGKLIPIRAAPKHKRRLISDNAHSHTYINALPQINNELRDHHIRPVTTSTWTFDQPAHAGQRHVAIIGGQVLGTSERGVEESQAIVERVLCELDNR